MFLLNIQIHFTALTEMKFDTRTFSSHCTYQLLFIGFQQLHTNIYLVLQFIRVCLLNARRSAFSLSKRLSQILPSMRGLGSLKAWNSQLAFHRVRLWHCSILQKICIGYCKKHLLPPAKCPAQQAQLCIVRVSLLFQANVWPKYYFESLDLSHPKCLFELWSH